MRILEFDELPAEWEDRIQLLDASTGWMPVDFKGIRDAIRMGFPAAEYFGVYAVEDGQVMSCVRVIRIPYTMSNGKQEVVSGIQGVITRREFSRRGLAKKLLAEAHRREEAAGSRLAILWTGHGNIAHNLYVSLGYTDVYSPKLAMKKVKDVDGANKGYEVSRVRAKDAEMLERIHSEGTKRRFGFASRPRGSLKVNFRLGWFKPESFRVIIKGGNPVAYFHFDEGTGWLSSGEVVMKPEVKPEDIVSLLEAQARGSWLTLSGTFVTDHEKMLKERGYLFTDVYYGLLARPLGNRQSNVRKEMGVDSSSFTCQRLDHF